MMGAELFRLATARLCYGAQQPLAPEVLNQPINPALEVTACVVLIFSHDIPAARAGADQPDASTPLVEIRKCIS